MSSTSRRGERASGVPKVVEVDARSAGRRGGLVPNQVEVVAAKLAALSPNSVSAGSAGALRQIAEQPIAVVEAPQRSVQTEAQAGESDEDQAQSLRVA